MEAWDPIFLYSFIFIYQRNIAMSCGVYSHLPCLCLLQSAKELARHMKDQRVVQIYWSTAQCSMLKGDIVLVDWYVTRM